MERTFRRIWWLALGAAFAGITAAHAQTRMVIVEGRAMQAWTSGIDQRKAGQPVLILEAGGGTGLDEWKPVFADLATLAPMIAYDRRGIGQSEPDTVKPTVKRVNQSLHALLQAMRVAPPYVVVGHSWGGAVMRGFAEMYPTEIAGYVYVEVPDIEATPEEQAAALPEADRASAFATPTLPPIPADTPQGLRAEYEVLGENIVSHWAEVRNFRQVPGVPVAVVIAAPPARLKAPGDAMMRLQIKHQSEWALASSNGLLLVSGRVGHDVMKDDPALLLQAVKHVLQAASPR